MKKGSTRARPIKAEVHFVCAPMEAPVGTLTKVLFGMSIQGLAAEISANRDGAWDDVYKEA